MDPILTGDLHLVDGAAAAIDQGVSLPAGQADEDIDGDLREPSRDIGADERSDLIFADGFQAG